MTRQRTSRGALLTSNLPQLQNLIKRDPAGYREEFLQQWTHYDSIRRIFELKPDEEADRFRELVIFISQVAQCYPKETAEFPSQMAALLLRNFATLSPDTRRTLVQNLVMLRNKSIISSIELLQTLFPLLSRTTSSTLRSFIRKTILSDIRTANLRSQNHKLNRAVQAMLFGMVERGMDAEMMGDKGKLRDKPADSAKQSADEAVWAIALTKELWKKSVWNDTKSVSIVALGCFHPSTKVQKASIYFFLGDDENDEDSSEEEDDGPDISKLKHQRSINKKTRSDEKKMSKAVKIAKKKRKSSGTGSDANFPALQLLHDPQTFAEKLYDYLQRYDKRLSLDHKILAMQLLSRVMGYHKLCVLGFYSYVVKYLAYHQLRVTVILAALAQSVHDLTPPDVLLPIVRKLAQEFVHPGVGSEVIAAGINAIREVCRRQPWSMEEDLLGDLVEYRKSRDKGVVTAARSLLQLYRDINPGMLKRRERGKAASLASKATGPLPFGHVSQPSLGIEGLELLEDHLKHEKSVAAEGSDDGLDGWKVHSDSEDSSSEDSAWIDVSSDDGSDIAISDSDEEKSPVSNGKPETESEATIPSVERVSVMATTKILTPADFALLNELKLQAASKDASFGARGAKRKVAALEDQRTVLTDGANTFLSEIEITGPRKKAKADYAERMASIHKGREGRDKFGSRRGKKIKDTPSSSTNRQKARNKPIMMILSSNAVRSKKKASLREKQRRLSKARKG